MFVITGRCSAAFPLRGFGLRGFSFSTLVAFLLLSHLFLSAVPPARAVVVRGIVTDPLGKPLPGARVQLIDGQKAVAIGIAGLDGSYEIRSTESGRFVLLTSSAMFYPGIGKDFYAGSTDEITQNIVLETASVHEEITVTATGLPMPLQQSSSAVTLIPDSYLVTAVGIVDALRQTPGVDVVETGQMGGATSLFVRGGDSVANKLLIDGIPAEDVGGITDYGTISSSGVTGVELYRGPDSVLYGSDAGSSVVTFSTPRGSDPNPVLNYSGSAGNFHTYQNEATISGAHKRVDYLAGYSRVDTSNALLIDEYHAGTAVANLGFDITATTPIRFTLRNSDSASGAPGAHDFYVISAAAKQSDQDLYSGLTIQNTLKGNWHNLARYGIARKREQFTTFQPVGAPITVSGYTTYYGDNVTIRGANGYGATGQAAIAYGRLYPQPSYADSNRDELHYQTDYTFPKRIVALFGFHYENERGSYIFNTYGEDWKTRRANFEYTLQFSGDIVNRIFYSLGGALEKNHLYGIAGTPRIGLAYVPVRPGTRVLRGTKIRFNVATGVVEPSLSEELSSLFTELLLASDPTDIAEFHISPIGPQRSRTLDIGIDQNIVGQKLILKAGYYHNQFSHQIEYVPEEALQPYFGINPTHDPDLNGADLNSLAFRAQGLESELQYQPVSRFFLRAGYTYLDAKVEQSFSSDALSVLPGGTFGVNPAFADIPIGDSPFIGSRPFRRPPHTGFFAVQYTGRKCSAAFQGAFASRSDDSTFLDYSDINGGNSLWLPNRDLDFGYAKLDANFMYAIKKRVTIFSELDNLLSQQHIGPIGYPALPFTVRAGLKLRIGGE
jgi:iron complex outermembrane receptor protein/vitamin B12 transporter